MLQKHILVIDDERAIRTMLTFALRRDGYECSEAQDIRSARALIADRRPDLVLVDWMLPDVSGLEFTRQLKQEHKTQGIPVVILTARAAEADKVAGLEGGADDYVTKPCSPRELLARIGAILRRSSPHLNAEVIEMQGLVIELLSQRVIAGNRRVELTRKEYRLLEFLMSNPERVFSREQLLYRAWGGGAYVEDRTVDVHILRLRQALAPFGFDRFVQTVRGAGYRFSARAE
jgi:two-component system phosphate regulon response regulator PhoB